MTYSSPTRTVGEVFRAVKRTFGDESSAQLEDSDIVRWINDAQDEINNKNRILKEQADLPATLNQNSYTFPARRIHQIEALLFNGKLIRNVTYSQALENYIGITGEVSGIPEVWWEWGGKFTLYPTPNADGTITMLYTVRPQPIDGTLTTKLSVPDKYYQDVVRYVLQQAYLMDEALDLSADQARQFNLSLEDKNEEERTAQHMTYQTITFID